MAMRTEWSAEVKRELGSGYVSWLPFGAIKLGDVGDYGPVRGFRRSFNAQNVGVNPQQYGLRRGNETDMTITSDTTVTGNIGGSYKQLSEDGQVDVSGSVTFHQENSFYLYAPEAVTYEVEDVVGFAQAIRSAAKQHNRRIQATDYGIFKVTVVKSGVFVASSQAGVTANVSGSWKSAEDQSVTGNVNVNWERGAGIHEQFVGGPGQEGAIWFGMWRFSVRNPVVMAG